MKAFAALFAFVALALCAEDEVSHFSTFPQTNKPKWIVDARRPEPAVGVCTSTSWRSCRTTFASSLRLGPTAWTDPHVFARAIYNLYTNANINQGFLSVCRARQVLQQCLGAEYDACVDPWNFMRTGVPLDTAFSLAGVLRYIEFDCNGGAMQSLDHWTCINYVRELPAYTSGIINCNTAYNNSLSTNGFDFCKAGQTFLACEQMINLNNPPCMSNDLYWYFCERLRVQFLMDGISSQCNFKCQVRQTGASAGALAESASQKLYASRSEALASGALISPIRFNIYKRLNADHPRRLKRYLEKMAQAKA